MTIKYVQMLSVLLLSFCSYGQNSWYVSQQNGDDANDGTNVLAPFETVEHATDFLEPSDTLFFMGVFTNTSYDSDYEYANNINDSHIWTQENSIRFSNVNGTENQYITFKPFDENTLLKGDGSNIFRGLNCSYLRIEGFEIYGEVENIPLSTAKALQFLYRENNSANALYRVPPGTSDLEVGNMSFPVLDNVSRPSYTDTRGLYLSNVHHVDIVNNHIHHTPGNGLRVSDCDYINIIGNEVEYCSLKSFSGTHGLVVTNADSFDDETGYKINILQNKVHHNYNEIYSWAPTKDIITPKIDEGKGISMQRNEPSTGWTHGRFLIANNITYWNGFSGVHTNAGYRMDFINNTCYLNSYTNTITNAGSEQTGNNVGISASESEGIRIYNNISFVDAGWGGFPISIRNTTDLEVGNNLVFGINGTLSTDPDLQNIAENTFEGNPLFEDADIFNFSLLENSPAIGVANPTFAPAIDFFNNARVSVPDLGAVESDFLSGIVSSFEKEKINTFPNPFWDEVIVESPDLNEEDLKIYNVYGQNLTKLIEIERGARTRINTFYLPKGTYFIKIKNMVKLMVKQDQ